VPIERLLNRKTADIGVHAHSRSAEECVQDLIMLLALSEWVGERCGL